MDNFKKFKQEQRAIAIVPGKEFKPSFPFPLSMDEIISNPTNCLLSVVHSYFFVIF